MKDEMIFVWLFGFFMLIMGMSIGVTLDQSHKICTITVTDSQGNKHEYTGKADYK